MITSDRIDSRVQKINGILLAAWLIVVISELAVVSFFGFPFLSLFLFPCSIITIWKFDRDDKYIHLDVMILGFYFFFCLAYITYAISILVMSR